MMVGNASIMRWRWREILLTMVHDAASMIISGSSWLGMVADGVLMNASG